MEHIYKEKIKINSLKHNWSWDQYIVLCTVMMMMIKNVVEINWQIMFTNDIYLYMSSMLASICFRIDMNHGACFTNSDGLFDIWWFDYYYSIVSRRSNERASIRLLRLDYEFLRNNQSHRCISVCVCVWVNVCVYMCVMCRMSLVHLVKPNDPIVRRWEQDLFN